MKIFRSLRNAISYLRGARPVKPPRLAVNNPSSSNIMPVKPSRLRYSAESRVERFLRFSIERIDDPGRTLAPIISEVVADLQEVVKDFTGVCMADQEILDHMGDRMYVVRDGGEVVGFGTAKYFDFLGHSTTKEKISLLWGTMIKRKARRSGLMVRLNIGLVKTAQQELVASTPGFFSKIKAFLQPYPIAVRTQSNRVWNACERHFKGVVRLGENPELRYQELTEFVAAKMGWKLGRFNLQHHAYDTVRLHEKDRIKWKRAEGEGDPLNGKDAWVFSGDFTLVRRCLTWVVLKIYYPLRYLFGRSGGDGGGPVSLIC